MKAIQFNRYGSPDVLERDEVPRPTPGRDQALIRVIASSVNSWDWEFLNGKPLSNRLLYGLIRPRPGKRILGADVAGIVDEVGSAVRHLQPGDRVFGDRWDNWGCFAEFVCAAENSLTLIPANVTFREAAAVPQAGVLALQGLRKARAPISGRKVLINGAGGGVGTFAVQLAKLAGAEVTGVDAPHKLDTVRSLGADYVIDFTENDFWKIGKTYDLIIDCQNFRPLEQNLRAIEPNGTYAMIGGSMRRIYALWLHNFLARFTRDSRNCCLVAGGPNVGLTDLGELMASGKLIAVIDSVYDLSEVPAALERFGKGMHAGKIVISVTGDDQ